MVTESERRAIELYPELGRLLEIRELGWVFQLTPDDGVMAVKGLYLHKAGMVHWADMLHIRGQNDAAAVRLNPDRQMVWQVTGTMIDTIDGLSQLPPPRSPFAPRLVLGKVGTLWVPQS